MKKGKVVKYKGIAERSSEPIKQIGGQGYKEEKRLKIRGEERRGGETKAEEKNVRQK